MHLVGKGLQEKLGAMQSEFEAANIELQLRTAAVDRLTSRLYSNSTPSTDGECWQALGRAEAERQKAMSALGTLMAERNESAVTLVNQGRNLGTRVMGRDT